MSVGRKTLRGVLIVCRNETPCSHAVCVSASSTDDQRQVEDIPGRLITSGGLLLRKKHCELLIRWILRPHWPPKCERLVPAHVSAVAS